MVGVLHTHTDKFGYLSRCVHKHHCTHTHTQGNTSFMKSRRQKWLQNAGTRTQKLATKQIRANTRKSVQEGSESPPWAHGVGGNWGSCVYRTWISTTWSTEQWGRERERRRWRARERGGADGSAIWWMEEKRGRWKEEGGCAGERERERERVGGLCEEGESFMGNIRVWIE